MYELKLSEEQREILVMALEQWLDPFETSAQQVEADEMHETPDEMLEQLDAIHRMFDVATDLKVELENMYANSALQLLHETIHGDGGSCN